MTCLKYFCLNKLKRIFGLEYDAKTSYISMEDTLLSLGIKWKWPQRLVQEQRLAFLMRSIESQAFLEVISHKTRLKRKRGRPRFRLIDAIKNDLEDIIGMDMKDINHHYYFASKASTVEKVIHICQTEIQAINKTLNIGFTAIK